MRRALRLGRWVLGGLLVLLVLAVAVPGARAGLKAPGVLAEAMQLSWPRPLAPQVVREPVTVGGVAGDRYAPTRPGPPVLFVPGATPAGLDDSRAIRAATALARAGRTVFVPDLDLYQRRLGREDVDRIVAAGVALAESSSEGEVVLTGFSYGGSFALLAAADEELRDRVAVVAVFGAYWDIVGVAQAAATGVSLVDGEPIPWDADPTAEGIMREQAVALAPSGSAAALQAALDGMLDPADLPDDVAALHDLVTHDDPARTEGIVAALPDETRARLLAVSPAQVAEGLRAPVIALHDRDDPAVPYGEALRLRAALPDARVHTVELFEHVDLDTDQGLLAIAGDLVQAWRFTRAVLAPQERVLGSLTPAVVARPLDAFAATAPTPAYDAAERRAAAHADRRQEAAWNSGRRQTDHRRGMRREDRRDGSVRPLRLELLGAAAA